MTGMPKVLVADDDRRLLESLTVRLGNAGFEVRCAQDGYQAVQLASRWRPDVAILDINMPAGDGFSVHDRIKSLRGGILDGVPIIYLTGERSPRIELSAKAHGAFALIHKPYDVASLVETLDAALSGPPGIHSVG